MPNRVKKGSRDKMLNSGYVPIKILEEVLKCCIMLGSESTLVVLKQAQADNSDFIKPLSAIVVDEVCKSLKVSKSKVFSGGYGNNTTAAMFIFVIHKQYLKMDIDQIEELFGLKYQRIWSSINRFSKLNDKHPQDMETLITFNKIMESIKSKAESNDGK